MKIAKKTIPYLVLEKFYPFLFLVFGLTECATGP
jgi:hypothetical protein